MPLQQYFEWNQPVPSDVLIAQVRALSLLDHKVE